MPQKTIYILHKNGAPSHYYGLVYLAKKEGIEIKFREFSVFSKLYKSILKGNFKQLKKQFINAAFLLNLLVSSNKKIVVGIAPFDAKLKNLLPFLIKHQLYYHTSWTCWDTSFHPKRKGNSPKIFGIWKAFLETHAKHIFTVTKKSKMSILEHYNISNNTISVVHHSLHPAFETHTPTTRLPLSFLFVGRLTNDKGIDKLLEFATQNPKAKVTFIGEGKEENTIVSYSKKFDNIQFMGYISNKNELKKALSIHQYLVLNSQKTKTWEELFGLIIIEAMSQGTLPIATNHSGPKEIIDASFGFLFEEGEITATLAKIIENNPFLIAMSQKAIAASKKYYQAEISKKWHPILN